jgi:sec-independent protein translocase protein TatB
MGNFTASEILTVIVVILIVFGPNRLPELARKAGNLAASARRAMDSLKTEINAEYGDVIAPLRDARDELRSAGTDIKGQVSEIGKEVSAASSEIKDVTKQALESAGPDGAGTVSDATTDATPAVTPAETSSESRPETDPAAAPAEPAAPTSPAAESDTEPPEATVTDNG